MYLSVAVCGQQCVDQLAIFLLQFMVENVVDELSIFLWQFVVDNVVDELSVFLFAVCGQTCC